jgi:hypothetical protein
MEHDHSTQESDSFASLFEKQSGFTTWKYWFVTLAVVFLLFGVVTLNPSLDPKFREDLVAWGVYLILIVVGVGCIGKSYFDARFIDREMRLASAQARILEEVDDLNTFLDRTSISVFRRHLENLYTISETHHSDISQDNLIEILHSRLLSRNQVVELFASILITIGLIGTIIGLIFMMNSLTREIATGESSALLQKLTQPGGPLAGLGIAFYTTLIGAAFGGVVLRILTSVVDASITRYTAHIAELTEVYILPFIRKQASRQEAS